MSGAPAGPVSTGKIEIIKDFGHAFGTMVYIFNCSVRMVYKVRDILPSITEIGA